MLNKSLFTYLEDGSPVYLYRITNRFGEYVEILNYGACIHSVHVLDKNGTLGDVVLGIRNPEALTKEGLTGITIGRCANRIAGGRFSLNGKTVQLECNQRGNHLHGASGNYGKQLFRELHALRENQVRLGFTDVGAGGYHNTVEVSVSFSFGDDHRLEIHYHMVGQEDTLLCPTNHAYFNLDGSPDILRHALCIQAQQYAVPGPQGIPEGEIAPVAGTPFDFRRLHPIGDALREENGSFFSRQPPVIDDTFLLDHPAGQMGLAARLEGRESGRVMEVFTDMPAMVVFTRYLREPCIGKHEQVYQGYKAIALETQYVPNAVNCTTFAVPLFPARTPLDSTTVYAFGVQE